jgi:hypothetical protein
MEKFAETYRPDRQAGQSPEQYESAFAGFATASASRLARFAGSTFGGGIYRLYEADEVEAWTSAVTEPFQDYRGYVRCFGRDWLCNQFCVDKRRKKDNGEPLVLLFEIGTGQVLKIPETLASFHSALIVEDPDAALAESFYHRWRLTDSRPLGPKECVGYKVPLFLGGKDEVSNLARTDAEVYWHLTAQALVHARSLSPGSEISSVSRGD